MYSKQVYKKATEELSRRRDEARRLTAQRYAEVLAKIPEIGDIRRELAETSATLTRLIIASPQDAAGELQKLRDKNLALQERRAALLMSFGYPAGYLDEAAACEICGGSGYILTEMCSCLRTLLKNEACAELNAVSGAQNCTFENFSLEMYPQHHNGSSPRAHMSEVFETCKRYAAEFSPKASQSLLMIGHTGLGKTHLSLSIAGKVTEMGFGVVYTPVQKLTDKLEASKFSYAEASKEQYLSDMENVLSCDLLVLDDLGAEFITQFSSSVVYNIVNSRLVEARPTIINTNLEPSEIEVKYSPRMLSRLMGGYRALKFLGKDIRFVKKIKG